MLKVIRRQTTRKGQATQQTKTVNGKKVTTSVDGADEPITMNLRGEVVPAVLITFEAGSIVGGKWKGLLKPNRGTQRGDLATDQEMLIASGIAAPSETSSPYLRHQQLFTEEQAAKFEDNSTPKDFISKTIIERYDDKETFTGQREIAEQYLPGVLRGIDNMPPVFRTVAFKDESLKLPTSNLTEFAERMELEYAPADEAVILSEDLQEAAV